MKLTDAQLARLAQLGVKYPWDPGDVWPLVERLDELEESAQMACLDPPEGCDCAGCAYAAEVHGKSGLEGD